MKKLIVSFLCFALAGCAGARELPVRMDPVQRLGGPHHLEGVRVALRSVNDKRTERDTVGRHREAFWFFALTQYRYVPRESVETTVEAAMHRALEDAGAVIVDATAANDVLLDVDVTAFEVTDVERLSGEETYGVVGIDVRVAEGERVLGHATVKWPFLAYAARDPGLVGDALGRAAAHVVRSIRRPT